ncbi:ribosome biogenesis GTPase Der [Thermodesulfobacteriota bacterium]
MNFPHCPLIALIGRPNVGKSTLFNRISKSNKAIVDPTPGVTRDRHYERVVWNEKPFILIDTGGIEIDRDQKMTGLIQGQTLQAIDEADIILFLLDGREGLLTDDFEVLALLRRTEKPVHYLINKIDSPELEDVHVPQFFELGIDPLQAVSSSHGYGVNSFMDLLTHPLSSEDVPAEESSDIRRIACIGRPNVGKSSLINRIVGKDRMVVSDIPGTTRDSVDTLITRGEKDYLLIDTAGIRRKGKVSEKIEKFSVMRALSSLERCDIALILLDADEGVTEQDTKVLGYALEQGRACLVLVNKWDLVKGMVKRQKQIHEEVEQAMIFAGYAPVMNISALTGAGVQKIFKEIETVFSQYSREFTTNKLNRVLQKAVEAHTPPMHRGKRLKFYYATQISKKPPTFILFVNYPKGVHFSYHRYLVNKFRETLEIDKSPVKLILRERKRKKYG